VAAIAKFSKHKGAFMKNYQTPRNLADATYTVGHRTEQPERVLRYVYAFAAGFLLAMIVFGG